MVYIYALKDPDNGKIRYVGQTTHLALRLAAHVTSTRGGFNVQSWLQGLRAANKRPVLIVLEEVISMDPNAREQWWIEAFEHEGEALLNMIRDREQTVLLTLRIPPAMKAWLEAEVRRRRDAGERTVNMTMIVLEALDAAVKAQKEG